MKATIKLSALPILALLFSSCSREPQPADSEIRSALEAEVFQLRRDASVLDWAVDAKQNLGTKVEPNWQTRFHASISLKEDTFKVQYAVSLEDLIFTGIVFAQSVYKKGDTLKVFGKATSRLYTGEWRTTFQLTVIHTGVRLTG